MKTNEGLSKRNRLQKHLQEVEALRRKSRGTSRKTNHPFSLSLSPSSFLFFSIWLSGVAKLDSRPALVVPKPWSLQNHQVLQEAMKSPQWWKTTDGAHRRKKPAKWDQSSQRCSLLRPTLLRCQYPVHLVADLSGGYPRVGQSLVQVGVLTVDTELKVTEMTALPSWKLPRW